MSLSASSKRNRDQRIFQRDNFTCQGCGAKCPPYWDVPDDCAARKAGELYLVSDHKNGRSGKDENLQALCWRCNSQKSGRYQSAFQLSIALKRLGRCMTYYPSLALVMGLKESIFLCQLIYWTPRGRHEKGDGWIYKSADEMKEETGLTYKEQLRLRKSLLKQDLLEENYDRETHQLFFRVKPEALDSLGGHMTNGHMPKGKVADDQKEGGTLPTVISNKEHRLLKDYTEEPSPVGGKVSKEETKTPDPRHNIVRERFKALWLAHARMTAPPGSPAPETAPWNGRDAGILSKLLTDNPSWTSKFLTYCLESYYFSEAINGGDPFHLIVPKLTRYSGGPLDRFNRPKPRARDPEDAPDGLAEARRQRAAGRPSSAQGEGS